MFKILEGSGNGVLAVELRGGYTKDDYEKLKEAFEEEEVQGFDRINLLCKVDALSLGEISPAAFVDDSCYALEHLKQLRHIAVVGNSELFKVLVKADSCIFSRPEDNLIEKYFDVADMDQAWEFVRS